jgi:hypothetical protein
VTCRSIFFFVLLNDAVNQTDYIAPMTDERTWSGGGKSKHSEKNLSQSRFVCHKPTWAGLGLNPGLCLERSARRLKVSGLALVPCCLQSTVNMNLICTQLHVLNSRSLQKKFTVHTGICFGLFIFSINYLRKTWAMNEKETTSNYKK